MGRAFISVDKKDILNMCSFIAGRAQYRKNIELYEKLQIEYDLYNIEQNRKIWDQAHREVMGEGIFSQYDFIELTKEFLQSSIEDMLISTNIILKILAIIDKRVGKRTLLAIKSSIANEHQIAQYFY
jgi:hypothetical protein